MNRQLTEKDIIDMSYVDFLALLNQTNRPPGGKDSVRRIAINSFIDSNSRVLHSGCNTGYCSFEIVHLVKCNVVAIDINKNMVLAAKNKLKLEPNLFKKKFSFQVGDAHKLKFKSDSFDLVFSGGSTAFMSDPSRVVREYKKVCKPYGFVGDMCLFYKKLPPTNLLNKVNKLLNIKIKHWGKEYWLSLYNNEDLELYYDYTNEMPYDPTNKKIREYSKKMVELSLDNYTNNVKRVAVEKLFEYMTLFNKNNKYLSYCVLLFRKDISRKQISLFGK